MDWAQMSDLDFGLIRQNISIKKASSRVPSFFEKWQIEIKQFSLPYAKNILSVCPFRGGQEKEEKSISQSDGIFPLKKYFCFLLFQSEKT